MDIERILSASSSNSAKATATSPEERNVLEGTPVRESEKSTGSDANKDLQPKNIKLVKFTPTSNKWQRQIIESEPTTPVRQDEQISTFFHSSQPSSSTEPRLVTKVTSEKILTREESDNEVTNDRLLGLLRSKNKLGKFHNLTINKDLIVAPRPYIHSKPEFISSKNNGIIRSLSKKSSKSSDLPKNHERGFVKGHELAISTQYHNNKNAAVRNSSFSSEVEQLLEKQSSQTKKKDTISGQRPFVKASSQVKVNITPTSTDNNSSERASDPLSNHESRDKKSLNNSDKVNYQANQEPLDRSQEVINQKNLEFNDVRPTSSGSELIQPSEEIKTNIKEPLRISERTIECNDPNKNIDSREQKDIASYKNGKIDNISTMDSSSEKSNSEEKSVSSQPSIIVQSMGNYSNIPKQSETSPKNEKHPVYRSLKKRWDDVLKLDDPGNDKRLEGLTKLFANIHVEKYKNGSCADNKNTSYITKDVNLPSFENIRPAIVIINDKKESGKKGNCDSKRRDKGEKNSPTNNTNNVIQRNLEAHSNDKNNFINKNDEFEIKRKSSFLKNSDNIPSEKIPKPTAMNSGTVRFNKIKIPHSNSRTILAPNSGRRKILSISVDPETQRRKFDRSFPSNVLNVLQDKKRYDRETIKNLVQSGVTAHRAFSDNPLVSVTNDVCSATNYEISHAYFYQQSQKRGKLEYLTLDKCSDSELDEVDDVPPNPNLTFDNNSNMTVSSKLSSPVAPNNRLDPEFLSKENWMNEWRFKLKSCTVYFDTSSVSNNPILKDKNEKLRTIFEKDLGVKLSETLNENVDLMIINDNHGDTENKLPFSQTVKNAIPDVKTDRKLRIWNQVKAWQFIHNLGIGELSPNTQEIDINQNNHHNNGKQKAVPQPEIKINKDEKSVKKSGSNEGTVKINQEDDGRVFMEGHKKKVPYMTTSSTKAQQIFSIPTAKTLKQRFTAGMPIKFVSSSKETDSLNKPIRDARQIVQATQTAHSTTSQQENATVEEHISNEDNKRRETGKRGISMKRKNKEHRRKLLTREQEKRAPSLTPQNRTNEEEVFTTAEQDRKRDITYLENLLENACILMDKKENELETSKKIMLRLSQEVMKKELKITSLEGQFKAAQRRAKDQENILEEMKTVLAEHDIEIGNLKEKNVNNRKRQKNTGIKSSSKKRRVHRTKEY